MSHAAYYSRPKYIFSGEIHTRATNTTYLLLSMQPLPSGQQAFNTTLSKCWFTPMSYRCPSNCFPSCCLKHPLTKHQFGCRIQIAKMSRLDKPRRYKLFSYRTSDFGSSLPCVSFQPKCEVTRVRRASSRQSKFEGCSRHGCKKFRQRHEG